ncbi:MAG: flagellar filament capping protein FliD [Pseudomonadales bacterium]
MAGISSLGVGSGIDIRNIVDQLVAAERAPVQSRLDSKETTLQAELSSFGILKSALSAFSDAVSNLSEASAFRAARGTSGDPEAIEVAGAAEVQRAASFGIQVDALAQAQSLASGVFSGASADVGSGSITFRFGTVTVDGSGAVSGFAQNGGRAAVTLDIPAGSTSLGDVRDAVNAADIGIRASILNDGTGDRLVFSATDTGAANGFLVEIADDDGDLADGSGLSQLSYSQGAADLTMNRAAGDAQLLVDGLKVSRQSNVIDDLLEGATLTLRGTTGFPVEVQVEPDLTKARELIDGFVKAYNELQTQIESVAGYDAETQQGGVLQGNSLVRSVESNMRRMVTQQLGVLDGRSVRALADIGIRTTRDGKLEVDSTRLSERLADSLDEVGALFGTAGLVSGSGFAFESSRTETKAGRYAVNVTQLADQARLSGSAVTEPSLISPVVIDAGNDEIELTVNGVASGRITLSQGVYTSATALVAELQSRINGSATLRDADVALAVEFDTASSSFVLSTSEYGSDAGVEITFADTGSAATLGLSVGQIATGVDVAGSIGGIDAEGFGRYLTAQSGDPDGLKIEVTGAAIGALGYVSFSRGISSLLSQTIDTFLDSGGPFSGATKSITDTIDDIADERIELSERLTRLEARLVAQFSAMDALVAQLNQTSSFLTSQLSGLESLARNGGRTRST